MNTTHVALVGGKGASLGEMTGAGIPVPPGFVVTTEAFERFLDETDLRQEIEAQLKTVRHEEVHTIEAASEAIQSLIKQATLPATLAEAILIDYKKLGVTFVAVRSSATAEDGRGHAWAGQLDSFLNTTEEQLLDRIKDCWASLFTPRAIYYRFEKGLHNSHISVAVVVQQMVESEMSGIAFSVHPITEDPDQLIIEAGFGLGEAVVSGSITPDSYVVSKSTGEIVDTNVAVQDRALYRAQGGGNQWRDLGERGSEEVLNAEQIKELAKLITKIETHYGHPQDIEWAYADGQFYITQSRPITTLQKVKTADDIVGRFKGRSAEKEVDYLLIPAIYYERSLYSFFNNSYFASIPVGVTMLDTRFEFWCLEDNNQDLTDDRQIQTVVTEMMAVKTAHLPYLEKVLGQDVLQHDDLLEVLRSLNHILEETYRRFLLFTGEYFATETVSLQQELQKTRMMISDDLVTPLFGAYRKFLQTVSDRYELPLESLSYVLSHEFEQLFTLGHLPKDVLERKALAFVVDADGVTPVTNADQIDAIRDYLISHNKFQNLIDSSRSTNSISGGIGNRGRAHGTVRLFAWQDNGFSLDTFAQSLTGETVLVTTMTRPEHVPLLKKAAAFVTDEGGITCHAAIIARELGKPCVIGTKVATQVLRDGDQVEVDATQGVVRIITNS